MVYKDDNSNLKSNLVLQPKAYFGIYSKEIDTIIVLVKPGIQMILSSADDHTLEVINMILSSTADHFSKLIYLI